MIKLIIFDLDGVLVEAKEIHFDALNEALGIQYKIDWDEHLSTYDGLKTNQKLDILTKKKGLPVEMYDSIWEKKQSFTLEKLKSLTRNNSLYETIESLSNEGFKIAVCSNSIRKTVFTVLAKLEIIQFMDLVVSNEDVKNSKPHPEMYWKAISFMGCLSEETLIVEDSPFGLLAAFRSKAHVLRVKSPSEVSYENLNNKLQEIMREEVIIKPKWKDEKLNVLIPMAGAGSRFSSAGFTFPKPLIEVNGRPMIQVVVENLNIEANFIYVVQKAHRELYNLDTLLNLITPNCKIVETNGVTEGAACTALLASEHINNDNPLFFANSDQFVEWDSNEFFYKMNESNCDGGIPTFNAIHPKWSFAKVDYNGLVTEVAEKNPISEHATVGFYFWKKGSDFVKYATQMIASEKRINNEYYVCPVYNEAIADGKKIRIYNVNKMWGIGTPEDLDYFIKNYK
jgi:HAD superfamily hydrolase (TIGR01509 family)